MRTPLKQRLGGAALAAASVAGLSAALLLGLSVAAPERASDVLASFDVAEPPAPPAEPPPQPAPEEIDEPEGAAAPPNLRSRATEVVAPEPVVPPPEPPPVPAATQAATGSDTTSGAADVVGPSTGAGGAGSGLGAGGSGRGTGSGRGRNLRPVRVAGAIRNADFPEEARRGLRSGSVEVSYIVTPQGRATDCRIERSSGSRALDYTTCELIETRFRYQSATDENGRPVESVLIEEHEWLVR